MSLFQTVVRRNKPKRNVNLISAASSIYSLAIDKNGRAWAWGSGVNGQLGDNTIVNKCTPVSVAGAIKTFCNISAGNNHSLAIDKNGRAWAWGYNLNGPLGDNTIVTKSTPVSVAGVIKTFCNISAGNSYSLAIDKNGRAWSWGLGNNGQLGDNTVVSKRTPVSVAGAVKTFCKISAGNTHSLAIDKNGRAWAWGASGNGSLGDNTTVAKSTPVSVAGAIKTFCKIGAGNSNTSCAIDKNGRAWAWGYNNTYALGDNTQVDKSTPVSVAGAIKTFCNISAGGSGYCLAIDKNGRAWAWGNNGNGQLGDNTIVNKGTPVSVAGAIKTFCNISAGYTNSLAIDKNGRAWTWGTGDNGQLGDNTVTNKSTPMSVIGAIKTFCKISAANTHSLAIDKNGRAWAWGGNGFGRLGDNTGIAKHTPVSVAGTIRTFCKISAYNQNLAIDKDGRVWAWGSGVNGQLGDNTTVAKSTPVSVAGAIKTFCNISGGINSYSLAIDKNGRAWAWGLNSSGQLGDNTVTNKSTPISVVGTIKTFCNISVGSDSSLAIDKNGRAWAWGGNSSGQLGDNTITNKSTPVSVAGAIKTFCNISAGPGHSLAIDKNGRAWAWGSGVNGQLGDNTITNKSTPVSVAGAIKTFCNISAGNSYSLAIDKNGRAWAWGNNVIFKLGITVPITPVQVCNI